MTYFIGIDGGGTQTNAVLTDAHGKELARLTGDAGIVSVLDPEAGARLLADLASGVLAEAKVDARATVLVCALAGAGREPERTRLEQSLSAMGVALEVRVMSDFEAALQDAFGSGSGILVVSGTGSSAWARHQDGRSARAGGWGHVLGDEGSGYSLGVSALRACMRSHDGRGADPRWVDLLLAQTGVPSPDHLVGWAARASKGDIAALAPCIFEGIEQRISGAHAIMEDAAMELARHVGALYERLKPWDVSPTVALTGGLVSPGRPLRMHAVRAIEVLGLKLPIFDERIDAARGAAALARSRTPA